jgi:hypothetical protein
MPNQKSRVFKWSLIFGIVIVINLFFNYTLSLVYQEPQYEAFCPNNAQVVPMATSQTECLAQGGQWNGAVYQPTPPDKTAPAGYCDLNFTCNNNFQDAQKVYDRNVFITLVLLGALCVAAGNFLKGNTLLGQALSLSGVLSFVVASMRYWSYADNLVKVVILAIALAILIAVALKKFKD